MKTGTKIVFGVVITILLTIVLVVGGLSKVLEVSYLF